VRTLYLSLNHVALWSPQASSQWEQLDPAPTSVSTRRLELHPPPSALNALMACVHL
jgi:hypothetical protein